MDFELRYAACGFARLVRALTSLLKSLLSEYFGAGHDVVVPFESESEPTQKLKSPEPPSYKIPIFRNLAQI